MAVGILAPESLSQRCLLPPESRSASCLSLLSGTAVSVLGVNCEAEGRGRVPSSPSLFASLSSVSVVEWILNLISNQQ